MPHIELTRGVDAIVVAPATANFIAKAALGLADDLLSTLVLARNRATTALLVAPAMNVEMWDNPATQRHVAQLAADGVVILGPAAGDQACGEVGIGRMLEADDLLEDIDAHFQPKSLAGVVLHRRPHVRADRSGPRHYQPLLWQDRLRVGTRRARSRRRSDIVAGPTALATPRGVRRIDVQTGQQMADAVMAALPTDIFIAVAAVADWRVANSSATKLKKRPGAAPPALQFATNPDILATVAALPAPPFCVGFAAESDNVVAQAQAKRVAKKLPLIVANRAQDALGSDTSELHSSNARRHDLGGPTQLAQARRLIAAVAARR